MSSSKTAATKTFAPLPETQRGCRCHAASTRSSQSTFPSFVLSLPASAHTISLDSCLRNTHTNNNANARSHQHTYTNTHMHTYTRAHVHTYRQTLSSRLVVLRFLFLCVAHTTLADSCGCVTTHTKQQRKRPLAQTHAGTHT
jgi:hypothetical protein